MSNPPRAAAAAAVTSTACDTFQGILVSSSCLETCTICGDVVSVRRCALNIKSSKDSTGSRAHGLARRLRRPRAYAKALAKRCPQDFRRPLAACTGVLVLRAFSKDVNGLCRKSLVSRSRLCRFQFDQNLTTNRGRRLNLGSW